jgi:glycosyltransferase involved in cell wall biosynthesis
MRSVAPVTLLVIQIPCFNEAAQLPATLAALPRTVPGVDRVEWLVIDDGSDDGTADVARRHGVDHVVCLAGHRGLARAFVAGLEAALKAGADVVVHTDADNQYCADDIPALVAPIRAARADIVVGARPIEQIAHFSRPKKLLQRLGSRVVRLLSGLEVADAASGFRAYSREAALRLSVFDGYTYTLETLIQAGQQGLAVMSVPVRVNAPTRESRLVASTASYVRRSALAMARAFIVYRPLRSIAIPAVVATAAGVVLGLRFVWFFWGGEGGGHVQSLILASILIVAGLLAGTAALLADLIAINRRLLEQLRTEQRRRDWTPR